MTCLLDTHTFLWTLIDTDKLSLRARAVIEDSSHDVFVSVVSFWEVALKVQTNRFGISGVDPAQLPRLAEDMGFRIQMLDPAVAATSGTLPYVGDHRDPFDRMLIWQAIREKKTMVSADKAFRQYRRNGLRVIW